MNITSFFKKLLGYIIFILHNLIYVFVIYITFFSNKFKLLLFVLIFVLIIIGGWVLFGDCLLSPLENYLLEKNITYENGKEKSMISYIFEKLNIVNKDYIFNFFIYLQSFLVIIVLIKINILYHNNKLIY